MIIGPIISLQSKGDKVDEICQLLWSANEEKILNIIPKAGGNKWGATKADCGLCDRGHEFRMASVICKSVGGSPKLDPNWTKHIWVNCEILGHLTIK